MFAFSPPPAIIVHDVSSFERRGLDQYRSGDYPGAIYWFNRGIELRPTVRLLSGRALAWSKAGHYREALGDINSAIDRAGLDHCLYIYRGSIHMENKNQFLAKKDFNRAVKLSPSALTYMARAQMHLRFGNQQLANQDIWTARSYLAKENFVNNQCVY